MTLQEAIRIIAEYDGWNEVSIQVAPDKWEIDYDTAIHCTNYHTSADALLPVWRKVKSELDEQVTLAIAYDLKRIGWAIISGNLEQACIELAHVIQQLNEKK